MRELAEAEAALVELDPVVHAAELDVADDVVDQLEADADVDLAVLALDRAVAGEIRARVLLAVHEVVDRLAVRRDGGELDATVLVLDPARLVDSARAALQRLPVGLGRVGHAEGDVLDAVAVHVCVPRDLVVGPESARDDEARVALLEDVGRAVAHPRLGACVRGRVEAERALVEVGRLLGVPHPELEVSQPSSGMKSWAIPGF